MSEFSYEIIRSARKTLGLSVDINGRVIVRAPIRASKAAIERFVNEHADWVIKHINTAKSRAERAEELEPLTSEDIKRLAKRALTVIPPKVEYYAKRLRVSYGRITIRNQRTKWGSCSAEGNLNFNCLLMLAPEYVLDGIIAHELCHRKEMNHSRRFYEELYRLYPEYDKCKKWLKTEGEVLMLRML